MIGFEIAVGKREGIVIGSGNYELCKISIDLSGRLGPLSRHQGPRWISLYATLFPRMSPEAPIRYCSLPTSLALGEGLTIQVLEVDEGIRTVEMDFDEYRARGEKEFIEIPDPVNPDDMLQVDLLLNGKSIARTGDPSLGVLVIGLDFSGRELNKDLREMVVNKRAALTPWAGYIFVSGLTSSDPSMDLTWLERTDLYVGDVITFNSRYGTDPDPPVVKKKAPVF